MRDWYLDYERAEAKFAGAQVEINQLRLALRKIAAIARDDGDDIGTIAMIGDVANKALRQDDLPKMSWEEYCWYIESGELPKCNARDPFGKKMP